jgi:hypothetical protein
MLQGLPIVPIAGRTSLNHIHPVAWKGADDITITFSSVTHGKTAFPEPAEPLGRMVCSSPGGRLIPAPKRASLAPPFFI